MFGATLVEEYTYGEPVLTANPNGDTWTPKLAVVGDEVFGEIEPINQLSPIKVLEKDILCGATRINVISAVMGPTPAATPEEEPVEEPVSDE